MGAYVLVHGAWHGGWCWDKVVSLLRKGGFRVEAPDLPGHGKDKTAISEVSLQAYTDSICKILDAQSEPVILVGHSMGGAVITQAAEYRPEKIRNLVYLTAYLLRNGESIAQVSQRDTESLLPPNMVFSENFSHCTVKDESIREAFYGDCPDDDVARAMSLIVPQSASPFLTPVDSSEKNFGRIPRVYIECLRDRTISPSEQKKMYTDLPCERVISMDTSHSPFFSAPEELVAHLTSL
jgi:pimeloyl-ACP methyl ester carboxylesterase